MKIRDMKLNKYYEYKYDNYHIIVQCISEWESVGMSVECRDIYCIENEEGDFNTGTSFIFQDSIFQAEDNTTNYILREIDKQDNPEYFL